MRTIENVDVAEIPFDELMATNVPTVLKGVARHLPLIVKGLESPDAAMAHLKSFEGEKKVVAYTGKPEIGGRFFYNDDLTGLNFEAARYPLHELLDKIKSTLGASDAPSYYIGSTDLDAYLPGLRATDGLVLDDAIFADNPPLVSIWIGNRTIASAHYDMSNNLACCMVGRRRFTLFPPDQVSNLYPGPLEPTPGGQVVTMVDLSAPDFIRFPGFREALEASYVAELEPGDLLFYPALWWHQVEALDDFNVMINYWWNTSPAFVDTPQTTLLHGLLSLRDRPEDEKNAWRALFEYYVFGPAELPAAHLPEHARGNLAPMDEAKARRLRADLLNRLNR